MSTLLDLRLFVGFLVDPSFERKCVPPLFSHFAQGGDYLKPLTHEGKRYLGKEMASPVSMQEIERVEAHIVSLLKKVAPSYPWERPSLVIFGH